MNPSRANADYRSRAESLSGIEELSLSLGRQLDPLLEKHGLSRSVLSDPEAIISFNALCQLLESCASQWQCADFGLRLAHMQSLNILGPVGLVARLSDTVAEAMQALSDRMIVHSNGFDTRLDPGDLASGRPASISYEPRPNAGAGRHIAELSIGIVRNVLATAAGMADFTPLRVSFQHSMPADPQPAEQFFQAPVAYQQPLNALYFDPAVLQLPTAIRDTAYAPLIHAYLEQMRPLMEQDIVASTRQLIGKLLATGRCSRENVADCLHLHPRTYQRRLRETGMTFNQLLDDYRKTLGLELLNRENMPLVRIADVLGYADQSSFHQAFRRWTGTTPLKYRRSCIMPLA